MFSEAAEQVERDWANLTDSNLLTQKARAYQMNCSDIKRLLKRYQYALSQK